ncbi:MAG: hypothetical protein LZ174_08980 [Thaumarchaeota archaeon]|nr:hypothetical protein [Candidatus Geocrenenecus arthurdayi]
MYLSNFKMLGASCKSMPLPPTPAVIVGSLKDVCHGGKRPIHAEKLGGYRK